MGRYNFKPPVIKDQQNPVIRTFKKNLSSTDITSLKSTVENNFAGVAFIFSGAEFDYLVSLEGPKDVFSKALNFLFPKGRDDITIQRSQFA